MPVKTTYLQSTCNILEINNYTLGSIIKDGSNGSKVKSCPVCQGNFARVLL